jgi:hypothetical protein
LCPGLVLAAVWIWAPTDMSSCQETGEPITSVTAYGAAPLPAPKPEARRDRA